MLASAKLLILRAQLANVSTLATLTPAIDHAIALAREAEYEADRSAIRAMGGVEPAYPPLVQMLAGAARIEGVDR